MAMRLVDMNQTWYIMFAKIKDCVGNCRWDYELIGYTRKLEKARDWGNRHSTKGQLYDVWILAYDVISGLRVVSDITRSRYPVDLLHSILNVGATTVNLAMQDFVRMAVTMRPKERTPLLPEMYDKCISEAMIDAGEDRARGERYQDIIDRCEGRAVECLHKFSERELDR